MIWESPRVGITYRIQPTRAGQVRAMVAGLVIAVGAFLCGIAYATEFLKP